MNARPKRLPRLWCARMGLLPFDVVLPEGETGGSAMCSQVRAFPPVPLLGSDQDDGAAAKLPQVHVTLRRSCQ